MTVQEITALIKSFRDERDWAQFHNPKDIATAISIEAAELLEHFLWIDAAGPTVFCTTIALKYPQAGFTYEVSRSRKSQWLYVMIVLVRLQGRSRLYRNFHEDGRTLFACYQV